MTYQQRYDTEKLAFSDLNSDYDLIMYSLKINTGFSPMQHVRWIELNPLIPKKKDTCVHCRQPRQKENLCYLHYDLFESAYTAYRNEENSYL